MIFFILLLATVKMSCGDLLKEFYELTLRIDTRGDTLVKGHAKIQLKRQTEGTRISYFGDERLRVKTDSVKVYESNLKDETMKGWATWHDPRLQTYYTELKTISAGTPNTMYPGKYYVLELDFEGTITNSLGWIRLKSLENTFIATNLQRTMDRFVFPSFEPGVRVAYRVRIIRRKEANTFSNSNKRTTHHYRHEDPTWYGLVRAADTDWVMDVYEETESRISSNQVAVVVTDIPLDCRVQTGLPVTFCYHPKYSQYNEQIKNVISKAQSSLEATSLTNIIRTNGHVQFIFTPGETDVDVDSLGLVLKSENYLFDGKEFDDDRNSFFLMESWIKLYFNEIIVNSEFYRSTNNLWESQWLFTGLARYYALRQTSQSYQQVQLVRRMLLAMRLDENKYSNTLIRVFEKAYDPSDPTEVPKPFQDPLLDQLSKGLMFLRMVDSIMERDRFSTLVRSLDYHFYTIKASKEQHYFWQNIDLYPRNPGSAKPKFSINSQKFINSWINQEGFPMIKVERKNNKVVVSQTRFLDKGESRWFACWWIPVTYTIELEKAPFESTIPRTWLGCPLLGYKNPFGSTVDIEVGSDRWIIFNNQMSGFYRVNYDKPSWELITKALLDRTKFESIHVLNRAQLVNDALTLSYMNHMDFGTAFRLVSYMQIEKYPEGLPVWAAFIDGFDRFNPVMTVAKGTQLTSDLKRYQRNILAKVYEKAFPTENKLLDYIVNDISIANYPTILRIHERSCYVGVDGCTTHADNILQYIIHWMENKLNMDITSLFSKGLLQSVLCTVMRKQNESYIIYLLTNLGNQWKNHSLRELFFKAFRCIPSDELAQHQILTWSITTANNDAIKEKMFVLKELLTNADTSRIAALALHDNIEQVWPSFSASLENKDSFVEFIQVARCNLDDLKFDKLIRVTSLDTSRFSERIYGTGRTAIINMSNMYCENKRSQRMKYDQWIKVNQREISQVCSLIY